MAANKKEEKKSRTITLEFLPERVTLNTVIFAEATATGTIKELKESMVGKIYLKQSCAPGFKESGIKLTDPDANGDQFMDVNRVRATFELFE